MALTNKIRQLRFTNGEMTQKRLAELVGVSRQTVNKIENGRHAPTVDVAMRIAAVFDVTVDQLFDLDNAGKRVRGSEEQAIPVDRPAANVQQAVDTAEDKEPQRALDKEIIATLRNIIG